MKDYFLNHGKEASEVNVIVIIRDELGVCI